MTATDKLKKMQDPEGFQDLWNKEVDKGKTYKQAYYDLEEEYQQLIRLSGLEGILDERRYSSYDSFRISKNRRIASISTN